MNNLPIRVLLVADDEDDFLAVSALLSSIAASPFELQRADSHQDARQHFTQNRYDVCLLRYGMEGGGPKLWSELSRGAAPFILLTANEDFGYQPGQIEVLNERFFRTVHPDDRERIMAAMSRATREGEAFRLDHRILLPDGGERVVRQQSEVIFDQDTGRPLKIVGTVQDITEQKQTEDLLRQSNELLRAVMESAPDAIFAKDAEGKYLMINEAGAQFMGRGVEQVIGKTDAELLPPEAARVFMENDRRIMANGVVQVQDEVATVAGVTRTYLATKAPLRGPNGDVVGLVGISRDISPRKQAEINQDATTKAIVATWESMTDAFFSVDTQWRFTYVNSQAARMWQRNAGELIGKNLWDEFPAAVGSKFYTEYHRALEEQVAISFEELFAAAPQDGWREVHIYPSPLGLSVYFRDTTERKAASAAMARLAAIVESSNDAIIGIADSILLKPDKLSPGEFEIMKTHAAIGSSILAQHHTPLLQLATEIALTHHERWNGGGYPRGLSSEEIPLEGRIVAVADVFDPLTHERP